MARFRNSGLRAHREQGSALFIAVGVLVLMGFMGIAALDSVSKDGEIAGLQNQSRTSLFAAQAGLNLGRSFVGDNNVVDERTDLPPFPSQGAPSLLGDLGLYDREMVRPQFFGDPAEADPIKYEKEGKLAPGTDIREGGQKLVETLWKISVTGQSPNGSRTRLEVMEARILGKGY
jgi:hypothetical protein